MSYITILYYKYIDLIDVESIYKNQKVLCQSLNLKGRVIVAKEGINGTLEGSKQNIDRYIIETQRILEFKGIIFKKSNTDGKSFPKLSIKIRDEIVTTNLEFSDKLGPHRNLTGKYLDSRELHEWLQAGKKFYIVDIRNDYEHAVGHFYNSVLLDNLKHFRDLPKILPEIQNLINETVVTVCTGGVRCEKASGFLIHNGFKDVYQLQGGIITYMEQFPNQDFLGKLYVFDKRVVMGFHTSSADHQIIGKCVKCRVQSESLTDYYDNGVRKHQIVCSNCIALYKLNNKSF